MILTDEEIADICCDISLKTPCDIAYARAIEAAILKKIGEPVAWWDENLGAFDEKQFDQLQPLYAIKEMK